MQKKWNMAIFQFTHNFLPFPPPIQCFIFCSFFSLDIGTLELKTQTRIHESMYSYFSNFLLKPFFLFYLFFTINLFRRVQFCHQIWKSCSEAHTNVERERKEAHMKHLIRLHFAIVQKQWTVREKKTTTISKLDSCFIFFLLFFSTHSLSFFWWMWYLVRSYRIVHSKLTATEPKFISGSILFVDCLFDFIFFAY